MGGNLVNRIYAAYLVDICALSGCFMLSFASWNISRDFLSTNNHYLWCQKGGKWCQMGGKLPNRLFSSHFSILKC